MSCKFCEAMEAYKRMNRKHKKSEPGIDHRYSVAIVIRVFRKGIRGCCSTGTDYRHRGCGYALNYCPECGRKMKGSTTDGMVV